MSGSGLVRCCLTWHLAPETWQAEKKSVCRVIPRSPPFLLADDEESRTGLKILRARFLAEFTLSEMRRSFAESTLRQLQRFFASLRMTGQGLRMTANGLGITAWRVFSAACEAMAPSARLSPLYESRETKSRRKLLTNPSQRNIEDRCRGPCAPSAIERRQFKLAKSRGPWRTGPRYACSELLTSYETQRATPRGRP